MSRWAFALLLGGLAAGVAVVLLLPSPPPGGVAEGDWAVYSNATRGAVLHAAPAFLTSFNGSSPSQGTVVGEYHGGLERSVRLWFTSDGRFNSTLEASTPDDPDPTGPLRLWCVNAVDQPGDPRVCMLDFVPARQDVAYRLVWSLQFIGAREGPLDFTFRSQWLD